MAIKNFENFLEHGNEPEHLEMIHYTLFGVGSTLTFILPKAR